jgi:hypothetical protein
MTMFLNIHFLDSRTLGNPGSLERILLFFEETGFIIKEFEIKKKQYLGKEVWKRIRRNYSSPMSIRAVGFPPLITSGDLKFTKTSSGMFPN